MTISPADGDQTEEIWQLSGPWNCNFLQFGLLNSVHEISVGMGDATRRTSFASDFKTCVVAAGNEY